MKKSLIPIILILLLSFKIFPQEKLNVYAFDPQKIIAVKEQYKTGKLEKDKYIIKLLKEADKLVTKKLPTIMDKKYPAPSGDMHDFISIAPYWWPDSTKKDGLPYIRRDGVKTPETQDYPDDENLQKFLSAVHTLGMAYYISEKNEYFDAALRNIRAWFIDEETKMNPNLNYAEFVKGVNTGRGAGVIEAHSIYLLFDAIGMLDFKGGFPSGDREKLKRWFDEYLCWLLTSPNGVDESDAENNHGTWYDVQVMAVSVFLGKKELAVKIAKNAKLGKIATQIEPDGSQPLELVRTSSWNYSQFNIQALFKIARIAKNLGVELFKFETKDGRSIKKAIDFLLEGAKDISNWKFSEIRKQKIEEFALILKQAYSVYKDKAYLEILESEKYKSIEPNPLMLLY